MRKPGLVEGVRERNRRSVYRCLLESGGEPLSRQDVCVITGLSHPTVRAIVQELAEMGVCREVGRSSGRGGRPAGLVELDPVAACVAAVDLSGARCRTALVDLAGNVRERADGPAAGPGVGDALFEWLDDLLADWTATRKVRRLAVALPGVVVQGRGTIHYAPALGWHDYPLASVMERRLGCPVTLENDVNALAIAELRRGAIGERANALFLALTGGVGMGVVIGGAIHRGSHSAAGEIGYGAVGRVTSLVNPSFNQPGPLEAHLLGLAEKFSRGGDLDLGTGAARGAFELFASDLAVVLQNAVCLLDPEVIVVYWPADREHLLVSALRERLSTPVPLEVVPEAIGPDATLLGVAYLALDAVEDQIIRLSALHSV